MVHQIVFDSKKLTAPIAVSRFVWNFLIFIWDFVHGLRHKLFHANCAKCSPGNLTPDLSSTCHAQTDLTKNLRILPLNYWLYTLPYSPNKPYTYSFKEFCLEFILTTFFMTIFLNLCQLHLSQSYDQKLSQLHLLRKLVSDSLLQFKYSEFFVNYHPQICEVYESVLHAEDADLIKFLDVIALDILSRPKSWHPGYVQYRFRSQNAGPFVFKAATSGLGILFKVISWNCTDLSKLFFCKSVRTSFASVYMLAHFSSERGGPLENVHLQERCTKEDNEKGFEKIIGALLKGTFQRIFTTINDRDYTAFNRDRILADIEVNLDSHVCASEWEIGKVERACWVGTTGSQYISEKTLGMLKAKNGQPFLDLTVFSPTELLAISVSGLVYFEGRRENLFKLTGNLEANIRVRGYLPKILLSDLVKLGFVSQLSSGFFCVKGFPGASGNFKVVKVGDELLVVRAENFTKFSASITQPMAWINCPHDNFKLSGRYANS